MRAFLLFKSFPIATIKRTLTSYPHSYPLSHSLKDFRSQFKDTAPSQLIRLQEDIRLAGRISEIRRISKNLYFVSIQSGAKELASLQLKFQPSEYVSKEAFKTHVHSLKKGDIIGALGSNVTRTASGELSLIPREVQLLSPCLKNIPSYKTGLENTEVRFRNRHLDLLSNGTKTRRIFELRSRVISLLREFLDQRDFLEVETPVLSTEYGGASAQPFTTHHQELDSQMFMRISPELYLKRLLVGGLDRVYEVGKQFRNEGIDPNHNPEFTSCEFYAAYVDYYELMDWTEELFRLISEKLFHKENGLITYKGYELNLKAPFQKIDFIGSLESATGKEFPTEFGDESTNSFLRGLLHSAGCIAQFNNNAKLLDKLFSHYIEPELKSPTFVLNHPSIMCPLAKPHRDNEHLSERFEVYMGAQEIINAYTESNDPALLRRAFAAQKDSHEHASNNEDFASVLDVGLPPTGGWGMGIDRLLMILSDVPSIKEVILFPTLKSKFK
eukprot:TRINITY_DN4457_c0_g1_i1.p1 TRINITY_DN4457_c0_g1~~TRINITY_DN4457_c0_g1_i1.p1  ORF type:complete len:499 (+),score=109.35 TRINITY_DN4457_c0_g1_i1:631-2127(+)